jgi:hypothetical protein
MILKGCLVFFRTRTATCHHDMSADIRSLRRRRSMLPRPVFGRARSTPPGAVTVAVPVAVTVAAPVGVIVDAPVASWQRSLGFK